MQEPTTLKIVSKRYIPKGEEGISIIKEMLKTCGTTVESYFDGRKVEYRHILPAEEVTMEFFVKRITTQVEGDKYTLEVQPMDEQEFYKEVENLGEPLIRNIASYCQEDTSHIVGSKFLTKSKTDYLVEIWHEGESEEFHIPQKLIEIFTEVTEDSKYYLYNIKQKEN